MQPPSGALSAPLPSLSAPLAGARPRIATYLQRIDHFNAYTHANDSFKQRYLIDDSAFVPGGPIFALTGAEGGDITRVYGVYGTPAALARSLNGTVLYFECRYFGESVPSAPEASEGGLGLLTVEQIVADYMELLLHYIETVCGAACASSPVVTFGGSMAGTLAALMRLRFPWLVHAAWASSSPLLGFVGEPHVDQYAWRAQVTSNWRDLGSPACVERVRQGFAALAASNATAVAEAFGTCEAPFEGNGLIVRGMAWGILERAGEFVYPPARSSIPGHCADLKAGDAGLALFAHLLGRHGAPTCLNLTHHGQPSAAGHAWEYLACTEIIHPIGSNNVTDFFPPGEWSVDDLARSCQRQFHVRPRPLWLPTAFGVRNIHRFAKATSRILFAYGTRDPWARLGVGFRNLSATLPVVVVENGSHCADTLPPRPDDTPAMKRAREAEARIVREWLGVT